VGATGDASGNGGAGVTSAITGTSVARAGGGGAGAYMSPVGTPISGGSATAGGGAGGVGSGSTGGPGISGTANTGGGGGGAGVSNGTAGSGGSGVVIFKVPASASVTFSAGVSSTSIPDGANTVYIVTATSTTSETVTIL
jgi:hypothetical protein